MSRSLFHRRHFFGTALAVAVLGGLALATPAAAGPAGDEASPGPFPITIETKYGPVTIESAPQRVVSVGYTDQDGLLALGVIPVGIRDWYGDQPYAVWPWALDELGDAEPEVLSSTELTYEQVAALEPDLIVGVSSGMTQEQFDTLSGIAPTVAQSGDYADFAQPWDVGFQMLGDAVGRRAEADAIIADIDGLYEEARAAHPEFEGATAAVAFYFDDQPGMYASTDSRSEVLTQLGFVIPPEFDELAGGTFFASISTEQIDLLDTDVLIWISSDGTALEAAEDIPGHDLMRAVAEGREVYTDEELTGAFSFNSPLSIPFVLEHLVPMLAGAVDGDPATTVGTDVASTVAD